MEENKVLGPTDYATYVFERNNNQFLTCKQIQEHGERYGLQMKTLSSRPAHKLLSSTISSRQLSKRFEKNADHHNMYRLTREYLKSRNPGYVETPKVVHKQEKPAYVPKITMKPIGLSMPDFVLKVFHFKDNAHMKASDILQSGIDLGFGKETTIDLNLSQIYTVICQNCNWFEKNSNGEYRLSRTGIDIASNKYEDEYDSLKRKIDEVTVEPTARKRSKPMIQVLPESVNYVSGLEE
jgi:hypothetical protein